MQTLLEFLQYFQLSCYFSKQVNQQEATRCVIRIDSIIIYQQLFTGKGILSLNSSELEGSEERLCSMEAGGRLLK